jgi:hypothetical protein
MPVLAKTVSSISEVEEERNSYTRVQAKIKLIDSRESPVSDKPCCLVGIVALHPH